MSLIEAHLIGNIGDVQEIHQSQHGVIEGSQDLGGTAGAHLRMIFSQGDITAPMQAIFNAPMASVESQELLSRSPLGWQTGEAIDNGGGPDAFFEHPTLQTKDLRHLLPVA